MCQNWPYRKKKYPEPGYGYIPAGKKTGSVPGYPNGAISLLTATTGSSDD